MSRYVEMERSAERHVKQLHPFADRENRQVTGESLFRGVKFPAIALRVDILVEDRGIGDRLPEKFLRNVRSTAQEQTVHFFHRHFLTAPRSRGALRDAARKRDETIYRPSAGSR